VIKHLHAGTAGAIAETAAYLRQGQLVIFPTDTVYGIGADAFNEEAVALLYEAKQRPMAKAIPILLADMSAIWRVARTVPAIAEWYSQQFWPGPLTLIVPKHPALPANISDSDSIAVRIPACEVARSVIRAAGGAVATSSANRSGQPAAQTAAEAINQLGDWVAAVLDDGPSPHGIASTILDCTGTTPKVVRQGPILPEQLALDTL
jgi:tRNA threonylcarbamoyl adenosine modification protein (Sua5/YciO/YrdC/YwlC family)